VLTIEDQRVKHLDVLRKDLGILHLRHKQNKLVRVCGTSSTLFCALFVASSMG